MKIGRAVRILRLAHGIKLGELAGRTEVSSGFLSMVENGTKEPSLSVVRALARELNVPMDLLLEIAQPGEGTLKTTSRDTADVATMLLSMSDIEDRLRERLGAEASDHR